MKMNKAGSLSTRSAQQSQDDMSRENAAWYIAVSMGTKFENPDVIFPPSGSQFHSMSGISKCHSGETEVHMEV